MLLGYDYNLSHERENLKLMPKKKGILNDSSSLDSIENHDLTVRYLISFRGHMYILSS